MRHLREIYFSLRRRHPMSKKAFQLLQILVVAIIITVSIVGCASPTAAPAATAQPQPAVKSDEPVTLKVYTWATDREEVFKKINAEFQKTHPNVTVEMIGKDGSQYYTILSTMIQSGEAPDLLVTHGISSTNLNDLAKQGYLVPLDGLYDPTGYPDWIQNIYMIDGKHYAIPGMIEDTLGVFYNKKVFDQYGLKPPTTQADFEQICETLMKNGVTPIALPGKDGMNSFFSFLVFIQAYAPDWNHNFPVNGKKFTDPEFVNATKKFVDWMNRGYMGKDYKSMDMDSATMQLIQGKAGMLFEGAWNTPNYKDAPDINVLFLKRPDGKDAGITSPKQDTAYSVYSKSAHKELAVELAKFLATLPMQQLVADMNGGVPASYPAAKGIVVPERLLNQFAARDNTDLTYADTGNVIPAEGKDYFSGMAANTLELVFGKMTPEQYAAENDKFLDYSKLKK
jgi:raffinose/stachyose/melibiose transport system substrate-binding protein